MITAASPDDESERQPVDKEQVRMLVLAVGPREAARQMGLSEGTVTSWSTRYGWLKSVREAVPPKLPLSAQCGGKSPAVSAVKAGDALEDVLAERGRETRLNATKYLVGATRQAAKASDKLAIANEMAAVSTVYAKFYPKDQQAAPAGVVNLHLLGMPGTVQAVQVQAPATEGL